MKKGIDAARLRRWPSTTAAVSRVDFIIATRRPPRLRRSGAKARARDARQPVLAPAADEKRRIATMRIIGWGASDVGRKRHHNEDTLLCNDGLSLYAVADGMGGHLGGERASRMAVEIVERELEKALRAGPTRSPAPPCRPARTTARR